MASDLVNLLERDYQPKKLTSLALQDAPLSAFLMKDENGGGEKMVVRFWGAESGGSGTTVTEAEAQAYDGDADVASFNWKVHYTADAVDNVVIEKSQGGGLSIVDMLQHKIKSAMRRHGGVIESILFGNSHGLLGRIATGGISSNTITLEDPQTAANFEPGMHLSFGPNIDSSSLRTGSTYVTKVDRGALTAKVTVNSLGDVTSEAVLDYIFHKSYTGGAAPPGLQQIIPADVPAASEDFGGLDRSTKDVVRYAGWRYPVPSGTSVLQGITLALTYGAQFGGKWESVFCGYEKYGQLMAELLAKGIFTPDTFKANDYVVNIHGVKIMGPKGPVMVVPSPKCPAKLMWALQRDTLRLRSVNGPLVKVATRTGRYIDAQSADQIKARWRSIFGVICPEPVANGCIKFAE